MVKTRRWVAAVAGLLLLAGLVLGAVAVLRWKAAGVPHPITPPAAGEAQEYDRVVLDRASIIGRSLRNDRGDATVRIYAMPPGSPWLQARKIVATQLDHWEQLGACTDRPEARILECAWREPTRWWPRRVQLTMLRPPAGEQGLTVVIIGSGRGA
ncbi:hypothetical protein [Actinoplanes friuliensis]|uniref:Uncharacterized protein n=1 Tax=Actinoplanes friuliensis DSM 7358 TaxID=1246995 RepID=U5WAT2_9ACTN|nr:hypothetical protein [Actinoplanes friuliensis]AGZ45075.1 hypothetical protein AFR_34085 [Actinoplanes friuliensis DSM 7358]